MGLFKKKSDPAATPAPAESAPPTLARRSAHRHSTIKSGRTIGEDLLPVEVIDEDATATSGITSRMSEYIGQAEVDYRSLGYTPVKAVIPSGAIREVDFYLDGHPGYIKMHIDRPTAVSVEDADRMLRYLADQGTTEFQYIDVRIPYKAYWK